MGQQEIIKALSIERKCKNDEYLSPKEIHKALENLGNIVRIENVHICLRKIRKSKIVEVRKEGSRAIGYRIKKKYINI